MRAGRARSSAQRRSTRPSLVARIVRISTVVVVFFAVVVLFGLVAFHALIVRNQTRIDALNAELGESLRARQELQLAVAQLEAPDRIRAEAIGRLGMIEPADVIYLEPLPAHAIADIDAPIAAVAPADGGGASDTSDIPDGTGATASTDGR